MTQWTSQQLKCLEAIGVPVYAHVPPKQPATTAPHVVEDVTLSASASAPAQQATTDSDISSDTSTYYKLGPWVLEFSHTIPVESYDWLRDLAAYCQSTPVQVSASTNAVNVKKYNTNKLEADRKKELWRILKTST